MNVMPDHNVAWARDTSVSAAFLADAGDGPVVPQHRAVLVTDCHGGAAQAWRGRPPRRVRLRCTVGHALGLRTAPQGGPA